MSTAVLASIQPTHCVNIEIGRKTNEVRKNAPKLKPPFKCYIYCTMRTAASWWLTTDYGSSSFFARERRNYLLARGLLPTVPTPLYPASPHPNLGMHGKVIAEFICDSVTRFPWVELKGEMQYLIPTEVVEAACLSYDEIVKYGAGKDVYFWHISDLKIYDKPKELSEFYIWKKCNSCRTSGYESSACVYDEDCRVPAVITRPPQSWCYVEEI